MLRKGLNRVVLMAVVVSLGLLTAPLAWGAPAITLSKTVGTVPATCAATNNVTVTTGTDVYYCFVATNTGDVTFNFHGLVDDHLGTVLNGFGYTLAPGASSPEVIVADTAAAPVTNVATWTAVDVVGGYDVDDTIPYNWEDISGTGTPLTLGDDALASFPIGFSFDFYGTSYTSFYASSNGFLADNNASNGCCSGQNLPNTSTPNGVIAGWWEDFNPTLGGTVHYQTMGTAPNQYTIVQFTEIQHYGGGNPQTLQYKLYETSNVIEVHYQAAPSDAGSHSAGIENQDGTVGISYYYGTAGLTTPLAVRYAPQTTQEASAVATATVDIADPDIDVTPTSLLSTQSAGQVMSLPLDVANVGVIDLDWTLAEEPVARSFPPMPGVAGTGTAAESAERRSDVPDSKTPDWFPDAATWEAPRTMLYDNGPLVTHPGGGAGGADASALQTALTMDTYGFGAQQSAGNRMADDVEVTAAAGWAIDTITFFAYQTGSPTTSPITGISLQIWDGPPNAGGAVIWGDTTTNIMTSTTWSNDYRVLDTGLTDTARPIMAVVASVGTTLPQGTYWLDWQFSGSASYSGPWQPPITILGQTTTGNGLQYTTAGGWAAAVDGVTLTPQGLPFIIDGMLAICGNLADVPWLSASPTAGTVAPAGSDSVDVSFDSTGLAVGTYEATICVFSNDPDEGLVPVPVMMEVVIPVELQSFSVE